MKNQKFWLGRHERNCDKCDIEEWCLNKEKPICNMELKEGDVIDFTDSMSGKRHTNELITDRVWNGNLEFGKGKEGWAINGVFVADINRHEENK